MKFKKRIPQRDGYYWYVNVEYLQPQICFIAHSWSKTRMHVMCGETVVITPEINEHYRWGDEVVAPRCEHNSIET